MELKKQKPPGKRLLKNMSLRTKWLITVIAGILLISYGLIVFSQAATLKYSGAAVDKWIILGIYSLAVFNGGLLIFGQSVVFKSKIETRKIVKKMFKERAKIRQAALLKEAKPLAPTKMQVTDITTKSDNK